MSEWIDLALLGDEDSLFSAIEGLGKSDRERALQSVSKQLRLSRDDVEKAVLRVLIERVRPFALPADVWARPNTASDDPRVKISAQFGRLKISSTPGRLKLASDLYDRFVQERSRAKIAVADLERCEYRCEHCGLFFCNEELARRNWTSPFGFRKASKSDALKPHWNGEVAGREPTLDHHWPISLYGDDAVSNHRVLCKTCNEGKADHLALEQLRPWVGLPGRNQLLRQGPISPEAFYAQLRRSPRCEKTGKDRSVTELTVVLRDSYAPAVLDNLETAESRGT